MRLLACILAALLLCSQKISAQTTNITYSIDGENWRGEWHFTYTGDEVAGYLQEYGSETYLASFRATPLENGKVRYIQVEKRYGLTFGFWFEIEGDRYDTRISSIGNWRERQFFPLLNYVPMPGSYKNRFLGRSADGDIFQEIWTFHNALTNCIIVLDERKRLLRSDCTGSAGAVMLRRKSAQ